MIQVNVPLKSLKISNSQINSNEIKKVAQIRNGTLFIFNLNSKNEIISIDTNNLNLKLAQGYGQCVKNCKTDKEYGCGSYEGISQTFCMVGCYIDCGIDSETYQANKAVSLIPIEVYPIDGDRPIKNYEINKTEIKDSYIRQR